VRRATMWKGAVALALGLALAGCEDKSKKAGAAAQGVRLAQGQAADLRLTPDGAHALFLVDGEKPRVQGVPDLMLVGELWAAATSGEGSARKIGNGVTNMPGGWMVSPDSRFVLYLSGYNPVGQSGILHVHDLSAPATELPELARDVTYFLPSPDSKQVAFVTDGVLHVGPLPNGPFRQVAGEVHTAGFTPDSRHVLYRRRIQAAGGFFATPVAPGAGEPVKLGEQVGDFVASPDSQRVAFTQRSGTERGTWELHLATLPEGKVKRVAQGAGAFAFSPDGKSLARVENGKPEESGDLYVGPADGSPGRKIGTRVGEPSASPSAALEFSPTGDAIAFLELFDVSARAGVLAVAELPDGAPRRIGNRVPNYGWAPDGKSVAFISRFLKPMYSVDLMLYRLGDAEARRVHQDVFAYSYDPDGQSVLYRSDCVRNARSCNLYRFDLRGAQAVTLQATVPPALRALHNARKAFAEKHGRPARTLEEVGFTPPEGSPYVFCLGGQCLPCTAPGCELRTNPCASLAPAPRSPEQTAPACAAARLDDDADLDAWVLDAEGQVAQAQNDLTSRILEGVYSFRFSPEGARLLVTHARMDSKLYDVAVLNLETRQRKLLAQHAQLPALFADPQGGKVVYLGARRDAAGVYASTDVP
jgi:hypothetical protein